MVKRGVIILILLLNLNIVLAGSVGVSPSKIEEFFEPGTEKIYSFTAYGSSSESLVKVNLYGELVNYTKLSKEIVKSNELFTITINYPNNLEKPGPNYLIVEIIEYKNETEGRIGSVAAVRAPIEVFVPYPGIYAETSFKLDDINTKEKANIEIRTINLGSQDITTNTTLDIYDLDGEIVFKKDFGIKEIKSEKEYKINDQLDTSNIPPGDYIASLKVEYDEGNKNILNNTFRVGQFKIDIIDYDYEFARDEINPFTIEVENKWNSIIRNVFAEVIITNEEEILETFKTISTDTKAWERKNITGYFDTKGLKNGRYIATIRLIYENSTTSKHVAVYVIDPTQEKTTPIYLILGITVVVLIGLSIILFLALRIKELKQIIKKRYGKQKKKP